MYNFIYNTQLELQFVEQPVITPRLHLYVFLVA